MRNAQFDQLMGSKSLPPRLALKGLDKSWRRVTVEAGEQNASPYMYGMMSGPMFRDVLSDMGVGVYYTQWQSISLGSETYLVAYRIDNNVSPQEMQDAMRQMYGGGHGHGAEPAAQGPRKFSPDTSLQLSLLNVRTSGSMIDIRAFDAARDIMGPRDIIEASDANLRRIGAFLPRLAQMERNGMRGLPMQNATAAREAFANFFHAPRNIFEHPGTRQPFRPNTLLAGRRPILIAGHARVIAFSEPRPASDGKRGVLFLDGHVERVAEARWQKMSRERPPSLGQAEINMLSLKNLQALNRQLRRFAGNGSLPSMSSAQSARQALSRFGYISDEMASHPITRRAYRANAALSGRKLGEISNPSRLVSFYEAEAGADGKRGAVFLDGHFERVPNARWERVKSARVQTKRIARGTAPGRVAANNGF